MPGVYKHHIIFYNIMCSCCVTTLSCLLIKHWLSNSVPKNPSEAYQFRSIQKHNEQRNNATKDFLKNPFQYMVFCDTSANPGMCTQQIKVTAVKGRGRLWDHTCFPLFLFLHPPPCCLNKSFEVLYTH